MYSIAVVDAFHSGMACFVMIISSEKADNIKRFIQVVHDKATGVIASAS